MKQSRHDQLRSPEQQGTDARVLPILLATYALLGGLVAFSGWAFDVERLTDWVGYGISTQPNTALLLALAGAALILHQLRKPALVVVLGGLVALGGALTLLQYIVATDFGFNHQLTFGRKWGGDMTVTPGRMGPPASTSFTLVGAALVLLGLSAHHPRRARTRRLTSVLGVAVCVIGLFSIIGYIFEARDFFSIPWLTAIAFQTATMLLAVAVGLVVSVPDQQPMRLLREQSGAGAMARFMLPILVTMPVIMSCIRIAGVEAGLFDLGTGRALTALVTIVLTCTLIFLALISLSRRETAERQGQEALRTSEARLRNIIEQLPAGVGVMDTAGRWLLTNAIMDSYMPGAIPSAMLSPIPRWRAWDAHGDAIPPQDWPGQRALRGETVEPGQVMLFTHEDGRESWMRMSAAPLLDEAGRLIGATAVVQDISLIKRAEQELREADRRKDEFLAILSHELRNPLAPIRMAIRMLHQADLPAAQVQELHQIIERQMSHMARLLDDLLDVSRIVSGKITLQRERISLALVLSSAAETARPLIEAREHVLVIHPCKDTLEIEGDFARLTQVVTNLLNNAAKYTDKGGRIEVFCAREGSDAILRIRDNGIGMTPEQLTRAWDLFVQGDSSLRRAPGGLGIGLSLVRRIVELHGGSVEARSGGPGMGSEFAVRLPAVMDQSSAVPAHAIQFDAERPQARSLRILIADDNMDAAHVLSQAMHLAGHEVCIAFDGQAALEQLDSFQPNVALLDIGMPRMNGYEVARQIRQRYADSVIVIALTGWGQADDKLRAAQAGFNYHLTKPVDLDALDRLLRECDLKNDQVAV